MQHQYQAYSGFRCVACNIAFNSFDDQKQHYFLYHSRPVLPIIERAKAPVMMKTRNTKKPSTAKEINCEVCSVTCSSQAVFDLHINGKKHAKAMNKSTSSINITPHSDPRPLPSSVSNVVDVDEEPDQAPKVYYTAEVVCKECDIKCGTMEMLNKHLTGVKHTKTVRMKEYQKMVELKDPSVYCDTCNMFLMSDLMILHRQGGKHKRKSNEKSPNEPEGKKRKLNNPSKPTTTIESCGYCKLDFKSSTDAIKHYQSKEHLLKCKIEPFNCEVCMKGFTKQDALDVHLKSFKHYAKVNRGNLNPEGELSGKLLKMREKVKSLTKRRNKANKGIKTEQEVEEPIVAETATLLESFDGDLKPSPKVTIEVENFDI